MKLSLVPHTHVDQVWGAVAPLIARAMEPKASRGEATLDQVRMAVVEKQRHLIIATEGEEITSAATIEFVNYPNRRVAVIGALGGKHIVTQETFDQIKDWCSDMGASELWAYAKDAQARLYSRVGMEKIYNVVGVTL